MKRQRRKSLILGIAFLLIAGACAAPAPPTLTPTATPVPPTATVAPTSTQAPAATAPAAKGHHIVMVQGVKNHPVARIMQLGFYEGCMAMKYDCELLLTDSEDDAATVSLAEQALAEPVDGMVLYGGDFPTIAKFKAKGIPVVMPHFTDIDQAESGLTAVVGADAAAYGRAAADAMADKLGGKGTVAVTKCCSNPTEDLAVKSFGDEMVAKYPNIKVLPAQEEGLDEPGAIAIAKAIIAANPDVSAAFSTTGGGPTTWSAAAAGTGKNLVIISMDYSRPNLDLVKAGKVYALVAQPLYDEFYQAVALVGQAIDGKPVQYQNLLPAPLIFAKDLDKYYALSDRSDAGIPGVSAPATAVPPTQPPPQPTAATGSPPTALPVVFVGKITGGPKPFGSPGAIAIDKQNNLYVLDAQLNAILKFDSHGKFITQWGSQGTGDGQFDFLGGGAYMYLPLGVGDVDVDGESNVYVVDTLQNRIEKFDSTGKFLTQWGSKGTGDGQFDSPSFMTTDAAGNIYVSDTLNNRIEKFDGTGKFLAQSGSSGSGEGQFSTPADLHFDGLGNLFVADFLNGRIQKFDPMGKYLLQWTVQDPVYLTMDKQNHIYVGGADGISEFDGKGKLLGTWGWSQGQGDLQFQTPTGLALDDQGNIYVPDSDLKVVKKFRQP